MEMIDHLCWFDEITEYAFKQLRTSSHILFEYFALFVCLVSVRWVRTSFTNKNAYLPTVPPLEGQSLILKQKREWFYHVSLFLQKSV